MVIGRPSKSIVRQRLAEMLFAKGKLTAYEAHKHYIKLFAKTSQRNVYYQLQKGSDQGLFKKNIVKEKGNFSWGDESTKIYYSLKNKDGVRADKKILNYFKKINDSEVNLN